MDIFVGNLAFGAAQADVKGLFEPYGDVLSVTIAMEKQKSAPKSRGFGFVQMLDDQQGLAAIAALNGREFMGRVLNIAQAHPKIKAVPGARKNLVANAKKEKEQDVLVPPLKEERKFVIKPGAYKGGRRSRSYMKRKGLTEMPQEKKSRHKDKDNPMRWRKNKDKPKLGQERGSNE